MMITETAISIIIIGAIRFTTQPMTQLINAHTPLEMSCHLHPNDRFKLKPNITTRNSY